MLAAQDRLAQAHLLREARAAAALDHPNICSIYEVGEQDGRGFIVMPLVQGETLAARLRRGALNLAETLDLAFQLADALAHAHAQGVIHRDVKPQNVLITPRGQLKMLDFGLAKMEPPGGAESQAPTATALSRAGVVKGTPGYMSPEQVRGEPADARSDAFSFGAVLYEMITGRPPFTAGTAADQIAAVLSTDPAPIVRYTPDASPELQRIVAKCLKRAPESRYQTLRDVATDLAALRGQMGGQASRRSPWLSAGAAWASAIVLLVAGIAGAMWTNLDPAPNEIRSMAILPLRALAPTPEGNHIGLGIADSMIAKLGGTGALTVRPTSAIHRYAREEVDSLEAARQLRVDAVLEGSWRRDGDRLRVSAHLLRTRDGTTLWADTLDMRWSDIFTLEDQLSQQIVQRLRLALEPAGRARLAKRHTSKLDAYSTTRRPCISSATSSHQT